MDLKLLKPIKLNLEVVEIEEDRLPSFKVKIGFDIPHPTGKLSYSVNDIWFECAAWDHFVSHLSNLNGLASSNGATLSDISGGFSIVVELRHQRRDCVFKINTLEPETGMGRLESSYEVIFTLDDVGILRDQFSEFPTWW